MGNYVQRDSIIFLFVFFVIPYLYNNHKEHIYILFVVITNIIKFTKRLSYNDQLTANKLYCHKTQTVTKSTEKFLSKKIPKKK